MSLKRHRAVPVLVFVVWCLGLLHVQVLADDAGNLGDDLCPDFAPVKTDGSEAPKQPPHLILIVADDLGWNDVSWNNPDVITPHLGKLAAEGVILNRSYVQPICTPTRSALLASRYPFTLGRQNNVIQVMFPTGLSLDVSLLPEELHKLSYETNMVGKWHLGYCKEEYTPTMRGFDNFFGYYSGNEDYYSHIREENYTEEGTAKVATGYDFRLNKSVDREVAGTYSAYSYADRATFLLTERDPQQPLFLYLAFQSVHAPLQVPKNYSDLYSHIEDLDRRTYLGMVTAMDDAVGKVVESLKATGHYDNSVIVFTTDNGGPTVAGSNNYPLRGNKTSLWEGGTRGSAFIHSPLLSSPGTVSNRTIHVTDWFPTFLHLAGGSPPDGIDGVNQWEVLNNSSLADARDYFVYDIDNTDAIRAAVRWENYKLVLGDIGTGDWTPPPTKDENKESYPAVNLSTGTNLHSTKKANAFVQKATEYFSKLDRAQQKDLDATPTTKQSEARHQNKRQLLEEIRGDKTDPDSTSTTKFLTVSDLLSSDVKLRLYDVIDDPEERKDISLEHRDISELILRRLDDEMIRYVAKDEPPSDPKSDPKNFNSAWSSGWC